MSQDLNNDTFEKINEFQRSSNFLLGGVVSNDKDGLTNDGEFRRYLSEVSSFCSLNKSPDFSKKSILYEIGQVKFKNISFKTERMFKKKYKKNNSDNISSIKTDPHYNEDKFDDKDDSENDFDDDSFDFKSILGRNSCSQQIKVPEIFDEEIISLHKKISNFSGKYEFMDLSYVICLLSIGISIYNNTGKLSVNELRLNKPLNIRALGTAFDPVTSSSNSVFIPRLVDRIMSPATFCALVSCVNGSGSIVFTDYVELDGNNSVQISEFSDESLVGGCFEALRLLLFMYDKMDCGNVAAFAAIKGFHMGNTVVGHTDEGGFFRDILRSSSFVPSFGAVYFEDSKNFIGLPIPSIYSKTSICAIVDSILLVSSAGVALCDPCVNINGKSFSTVFTNKKGNEDDCSRNISSDYVKDNFNNLSLNCKDFFSNYSRFCGKMFGVSVEERKVNYFLQFSLSVLSQDEDNRHLKFRSIAPFYFIEPTSLFSTNTGSFVEKVGLGPVAYLNSKVSIPFFENISLSQDYGIQKLMSFQLRSPRTSGLLMHLNGHPENGLSNITPWNFVAENFSLYGGVDIVEDKRDNKEGFNKYFWGRGQSGIFAPSECNYIGQGMSARFTFSGYDDDFNIRQCHIPTCDEILSGSVDFETSRPFRIENGKISQFSKKIRKERNKASTALMNACKLNYSFNISGGEIVEPSNTEPLIQMFTPLNNDVQTGESYGGELNSSTQSKGPTIGFKIADQALRPRPGRNFGNVGSSVNRPKPKQEKEKQELENEIINETSNFEPSLKAGGSSGEPLPSGE